MRRSSRNVFLLGAILPHLKQELRQYGHNRIMPSALFERRAFESGKHDDPALCRIASEQRVTLFRRSKKCAFA
jgi:hypothetical protein